MSRQTQEVKRKLTRINAELLNEIEHYENPEEKPAYDFDRLVAMQNQIQADITFLEECVEQSKADKSDPLTVFRTAVLAEYRDIMNLPTTTENPEKELIIRGGRIDARFHTTHIAEKASRR